MDDLAADYCPALPSIRMPIHARHRLADLYPTDWGFSIWVVTRGSGRRMANTMPGWES